MKFIKFLITGILFAGCQSQHDRTSDPMSANVNWQKVLECRTGSDVTAVVDVDANDRRYLQVVVRDQNAYIFLDSKITFGQIRNANERIYSGQTTSGVFAPEQFVNVFSINPGNGIGFEAAKIGDKLELRDIDLKMNHCGGELRGNNYSSCARYRYAFDNCH